MPEQIDLSHAIGLPPEQAIKYFEAKGYKITWDWHEMWQDAHAKAFTVAKVSRLDILQDIRGAIDKALVDGTTFDKFRDDLTPLLKAKGWWGRDPITGAQLGSPHRLETIYRTNMQTAYMAGRYKDFKENADDRPYWQYIAVMDNRTRPAHAALNGKVFRHDDVFWKTHFPPLGFRCRCRTRALTAKQIAQKGLKVLSGEGDMVAETVEVGRDKTPMSVTGWKDAKGNVHFTDPGWSYNPGESSWISSSELAAKEKAVVGGLPVIAKKSAADLAIGGGKFVKGFLSGDIDGVKIFIGTGVSVETKKTAIEVIESHFAKIRTLLTDDDFRALKEVRIFGRKNPHDSYWAKKYKMPRFESYMTGGNGMINMWRGAATDIKNKSSQDGVLSSLLHEHAHCIAMKRYGNDAFPPEWARLTANEGWVSKYSEHTKSLAENYAETFKLMLLGSIDGKFSGKISFLEKSLFGK